MLSTMRPASCPICHKTRLNEAPERGNSDYGCAQHFCQLCKLRLTHLRRTQKTDAGVGVQLGSSLSPRWRNALHRDLQQQSKWKREKNADRAVQVETSPNSVPHGHWRGESRSRAVVESARICRRSAQYLLTDQQRAKLQSRVWIRGPFHPQEHLHRGTSQPPAPRRHF